MSREARSPSTRHLATLAGICLLTTTLAIGQPSVSSELKLERLQVVEHVADGAVVRVVNRRGDVRLRFGGHGEKVEVLAILQQLPPDDPPLRLIVQPSAEGLEVFLTPAEATGDGQPPDRADLTLMIPAGTAVQVETGTGLIEARGLRSDLTADTRSGDIFVAGNGGRVQLHSDHGEISVVLEQPPDPRVQTISTTTGDVVLSTAGDLAVEIATSGRICSDYSTEIEHRSLEEPDKHARVQIGAATGRLRVTSKRGDVSLQRRPTAGGQPAGEGKAP